LEAISQSVQDTEQRPDSLGAWAWLAAIAPLLAAAAMHSGPRGNMKDLVARMAGKAGGSHEPDWAARMSSNRLMRFAKGHSQTDEAMRDLEKHPGVHPDYERAEMDYMLKDRKTQWPNLDADLRGHSATVADPLLPTSAKYDKIMGAPPGSPTQWISLEPSIYGRMLGGIHPDWFGADFSPDHQRKMVPLDPYELFMAALGPTNFEPPPRQLPPPPGKR
jgi:hypothetical protein